MKKTISILAIAGLVLALAPAAQASISGTGELSKYPTTFPAAWSSLNDPNPGDWTLLYMDGSVGQGTLDVTGGNILDTTSVPFTLGWGAADGTVTITGGGSKLVGNSVVIGYNNGHGDLIVEAGGLVDATGQLHIGATGLGTVLVTGANSILTTPNTMYFGQQATGTGILTVEDSGLVQASGIQFGWDSNPNFNSIHMGVGGVLAVSGDKTGLTQAQQFSHGGLFTIQGAASDGEIRYNPSGDGTTWVNMTGATEGVHYTLTYAASGADPINGQDVNGYTVLTIGIPPPAGTVFMIK
jgi:T5SS/PEP-CTERM-associated repeat protein